MRTGSIMGLMLTICRSESKNGTEDLAVSGKCCNFAGETKRLPPLIRIIRCPPLGVW